MSHTFIDVFAGCGGLSLGLIQSGWNGLFAIEKDEFAFETFRTNLIEGQNNYTFDWPTWLPIKPIDIHSLLSEHYHNLENIEGMIDLVAGGPPCQGFSFAGRRSKKDPRNQLFVKYIEFIEIVKPRFVLIENVTGIAVGHGSKARRINNRNGVGRPIKPYSEKIIESLEELNYSTFPFPVLSADFGVPQLRPRFIIIGVTNTLLGEKELDPKVTLENLRNTFLRDKGLPTNRHITVKEAISDLVSRGSGVKLVECEDSSGFKQIAYSRPKTHYQEIMNAHLNGKSPNSMRLVNHRAETIKKFREIQLKCPAGVTISKEKRTELGLKKHQIVPLHPDKPSHTLTTLPDDLLHYSQPRIMTVRECARLQSFPDWFEFKGNYTTGGQRRKNECPRYTQVGNAVPPFLGEAIGIILKDIINRL